MPLIHILLAIGITFIWGTNFVVIKWGVTEFPPFLFATLRFTASALPWVLFVPRPEVPWRTLATVGLLLGAGQFGLLFLAMQHDITPGLASLLMQSQAFFTILLAVIWRKETIAPLQVLALALAGVGIGLIGWRTVGRADVSITATGFALVIGAAVAWSIANQVVKGVGRVDMLRFMVWCSVFAVPPLLLLALLADTPATLLAAVAHASPLAWLAVAWQAVGNTLIGFGVWNWLLTRYPAATVAPLSLLVPIFGMSAAALVFDEPLPAWKIVAATLIIAGLTLNFAAGSLVRRFAR
ncbi:MAG: EamA family transporter [Proteobacteria bacterium]|nr:EamA family transporter [Pseudomonadota bacterium]